MTQPHVPKNKGASLCDAPLVFCERRSLNRFINESLSSTISRQTLACLLQIKAAIRSNALSGALRLADRAWRCFPQDASTLAPMYGRLLLLEGRDYDAALGLLHRSADLTPDPDVAALIALTLLRLRRYADARQALADALAEYCVVPSGLLFDVAGALIQEPATQAPGWIGRGPALGLVGEITSLESPNALDVRVDGGTVFTQILRHGDSRGDRRTFEFACPQARLDSSLEVTSHGAPLLGSGSRLPLNFRLDGRSESQRTRITGWARVGWLPNRPPRLRFEDDEGNRYAADRSDVVLRNQRWCFDIDLRRAGQRGSRVWISARLPGGRWQALPDAPLLLERHFRSAQTKPARLRTWGASGPSRRLRDAAADAARPTDIIIPVYSGREETLACIDAVLATVGPTVRVIAVDDATEDPLLAAALDTFAAEERITLLRNAENQGFVASCNRALALHPTHDVVLLNSDTLVFGDWLTRLRAAAYCRPGVGTVTPLSNSGSIASYPHPAGADVAPEYAAALHELAVSTHSGVSVEIPAGVGFCLYIRRDCIQDVGSLDVALFGKGYGEETDFCMRARRKGWSHRLAADVFVYHSGGVSFAGRRAALLDRSQRLLNLRHPGYETFIRSFLTKDPLHQVRRELDEHRLSAFQGRFVLLVTLAMTGGVERFVTERCRSLRAKGLYPLVLRPVAAGNLRRCELWTEAIDVPNLSYDVPKDLQALTALLRAVRVDAIEIQHFLHLDARVVDAVRALPVPYDVFVHDYSWICPRVTLIDGSGRYCGEPVVSVCQTCVRRNGSELGESISVAALRARSANWLRGARRVVAPSVDTASRLQRHFHHLAVDVEPHTNPGEAKSLLPRGMQRPLVRIALIGAIGDHKGYRILLNCARDARTRRLPLEFVVIGYTRNDAALLATDNVFVTGRYSEAEAWHLLQREEPDIIWLPSVWPETWCYALDHALEAGLPVVAFDLGAMAERLRTVTRGVLLPLELRASQINDRLLHLAGRSALAIPKQSRSVQSQPSRGRDDVNMKAAQSGKIRMKNSSDGTPTQDSTDGPLSASVQVLPLPAGLYLFSVKAATPALTRATGQLSLPAVHVGLGPGVRPDDVEFVGGPNTHGSWLFAQGDLLVTKINGVGATLIMTSVRAPGGEVLSIRVERLESRADAAQQQPAAAAGLVNTRSAAPHAVQPNTRSSNAPDTLNAIFGADEAFLPIQVGAHVRTRGDMTFSDVPWAGRVAPGLWIESFAVKPLKGFGSGDIEYKGLTGSGFETPWLSDEKMCGTKGMAVPLVGFAVRLKSSPNAAQYDCEYSGYFQSGVTVGPMRNGVPCRSTVANDPLEGMQIRLVRRANVPLQPNVVQVASPAKRGKPIKHGAAASRREPIRGARSKRGP